MAKKIKIKKPADPERSARIRRRVLNLSLALSIIAVAGVGLRSLKRHVETDLTMGGSPPEVVIVNRPPWMSDFLAAQIAAAARPIGAHSAFDHQMLVDSAKLLESDPRIKPWIKTVRQLRRAYHKGPGDVIELDCEFRAPVALVQFGEDFWLVDGEGVRLPDRFTVRQIPQIIYGRDSQAGVQPNIRVIQGVRQAPPRLGGQTWAGDDLKAGLDLVRLLYGKPFCDEILTVDVSNFDGRRDAREAQLVLVTKYLTRIQWGRPINAKDYFVEVSTSQKLDYLSRIFGEYHRVDAGKSSVDIRFDTITYPSTETGAHADSR